jgi:transposase
MSKPAIFSAGTADKMKILLKDVRTATNLRRIQSVLLGAEGMRASVIASIVGLTEQYIWEIWQKYREKGEKALLGEIRGSGRGRAILTSEDEKYFLKPFLKKAESSGILIVSDIHRAYEEVRGKKTQLSVVYRLLHRHGWRKIVPRPSHPKTSKKAQEEFLKTFPPESKGGTKKSKNK